MIEPLTLVGLFQQILGTCHRNTKTTFCKLSNQTLRVKPQKSKKGVSLAFEALILTKLRVKNSNFRILQIGRNVSSKKTFTRLLLGAIYYYLQCTSHIALVCRFSAGGTMSQHVRPIFFQKGQRRTADKDVKMRTMAKGTQKMSIMKGTSFAFALFQLFFCPLISFPYDFDSGCWLTLCIDTLLHYFHVKTFSWSKRWGLQKGTQLLCHVSTLLRTRDHLLGVV